MRLLESSGGRTRSGAGATMSVVVHAAIIAATAIGTARAHDAVAPPPERLIPIPPYIYDPPRAAPPTTNVATGPRRPDPVAQGERVLAVPTVIRDGLPPIDLDVKVPIDGRTPVTIGGPSTRGEVSGGFGGAPAYGAADASGTWEAHTVEVPVVPDARNPQPAYPEMLRTAGIEGRVVVEFVVDSTGRVRGGSLAVVEASHELFTSSVRRTLPSLRFTPARVQGRRVAQRVRVPFEFEVR
jgi:protein TonB